MSPSERALDLVKTKASMDEARKIDKELTANRRALGAARREKH